LIRTVGAEIQFASQQIVNKFLLPLLSEVKYALKFGVFGQLAHAVWVERELKKIFDYREKILAELLPTM
jgi:hypothetical protein